MLCTDSQSLLNSSQGRIALNYRSPTNVLRYDPATKNLHVTWDILMQNYRTINAESCELISLIPANDQFWEYFTEKISKMSQDQKIAFMSV